MFNKMPLLLIAIILIIVFLGQYIPLEVQQFLYAVSLFIKSLIIFLLPIIIFSLLFKAALCLASSATRVILLIFIAVCFSNFISTFVAHYVGMWVYQFDLSVILPNTTQMLEPTWSYTLPHLIKNDIAMFAGAILGIVLGMFKPDYANKVADNLAIIVNKILASFVYLIPLFVAGFMIKLQFDGVMETIIKDYALIFVVVAVAQFAYISLIYLYANNFKLPKFLQSIKNMFPPAVLAFSSMSSAATMPLTIVATEKNVPNKDLVGAVIPSTVNIHLIGDCFAITIFAYAILKNYGLAEPTFMEYMIYAFYFVFAKFSVAGVPGGGVLIMLPILEEHLGFNADMLTLITALYILLDPIITVANVMGNGGFAMLMEKFKIFKKKAPA
jgi:Na+/H+-dicarboxylate symporter